jgi:FkbH-like protein
LVRLANFALDTDKLIKLSRLLRELAKRPEALKPLHPFRLGLVSNATTDFIVPTVAASGLRYGLAIDVVVPPFGQFVQAVADPHSQLYACRLNAVLLALDHRAFGLDAGGNVEDALALLKSVRSHVQRQAGVTCIVQTLARVPEPLQGSLDLMIGDSQRAAVQEFNSQIVAAMKGSSDVILDVAGMAETVGLARWHDPVMWHTAKLPFAQAMVPLYADHVARLVAAIVGKTRRCLVLDLDNTLWGGVIGDDGIQGIRLGQGDSVGEAFLAVQRHALQLGQRGVILAVSSKNEDDIARKPFREHPEMLLREKHIAAFQANWVDKAENLRAVARELNIGTDALVFVDDNPAERALVRQEMPEVAVPELPPDPAYYPRVLAAAGYFDAVALSADDLKRNEYYQGRAARAALKDTSTDVEAYLRSLDMVLTVSSFDEMGRTRIAQLINKTNQFNLTTHRYSEAEVARMESDSHLLTLQARLTDRFGDNGMISLIICGIEDSEWLIDTWLMSCRVLSRKVEYALANILAEAAASAGATALIGHYIPTERNDLVREHYARLGFSKVGQEGAKTMWRRDVVTFQPFEVPIRVVRVGNN